MFGYASRLRHFWSCEVHRTILAHTGHKHTSKIQPMASSSSCTSARVPSQRHLRLLMASTWPLPARCGAPRSVPDERARSTTPFGRVALPPRKTTDLTPQRSKSPYSENMSAQHDQLPHAFTFVPFGHLCKTPCIYLCTVRSPLYPMRLPFYRSRTFVPMRLPLYRSRTFVPHAFTFVPRMRPLYRSRTFVYPTRLPLYRSRTFVPMRLPLYRCICRSTR